MKFPWSKSELPVIPRGVAFYFDKSRFLICPAIFSISRSNGPGTPCQVLNRSISDHSLGGAILELLSKSRTELSEEEFRNEVGQVLQEANVGSLNDLQKKWSYITIEEGVSELTISPMRRCRQGGFISFQDDPVLSSEIGALAVAAKVRAAATSLNVQIIDEDDDTGHY